MANLRVVNRQIAVWYILYLVEVLPMFPNIKIYTNKMFANTKILWFFNVYKHSICSFCAIN